MLSDKNAVITGGTRGIGKAIALKFAENGADVAIIATSESDAARETLAQLKKLGSDARLYVCDVRNPEEVTRMSEMILKDYGRIDILVNNAGITRDNILPALKDSDIDDVIDVNLKGCMYVTRAFI